MAGAFTGALTGAVVRGHRNIVPGALVFGLIGFVGQYGYDRLDASHTAAIELDSSGSIRKLPLLHRITNSRWSPMKLLSDGEYEAILKERLVRVETDIALIEEDMDKLRRG